MDAFSPQDLANMQDTQESAMMDVCVILRPEEVQAADGQTKLEYPDPEDAYLNDTICGIDQRPGEEYDKVTMTTLHFDAVLRLPLGTAIQAIDRVAIIARFGDLLSEPLIYGVVSPVYAGPSGLRVLLGKVIP